MNSPLKCGALAAFALLLAASVTAAPRPNIIFILCDDLGFGDTGPTFQNARAAKHDPAVPAFSTPHLDQFAAEGLWLTNHYCGAPVCAPSRATIMLGQTQGHANVRDNQFDKAIANNHTLGSVLRTAGYATAAIGKWGLQGRGDGGPDRNARDGHTETRGGSPQSWPAYPTKRGFDFYFGYVRHVDGHFHYPKEDGREVWENNQEISAGLDGCYTTDLFTARAKRWITEHHQAAPQQPFFLYLAYDTPHAKLELPPGPYPTGGGLRGGVQWLGQAGHMINTSGGQVDGWMDPAVANATWDNDHNPATPEVPWPDVQRRYATDVRRIDQAVGDVMQLLKDLGIDRNTLVVFTSDNGPSIESYLKHEPYAPTFFSGYGPFDGIKRDVLEGGEREPTFVRWPAAVAGGRIDRTPSGQWDWLATFADAAGLPPPAASDGVSLLPTLTGRGSQRPSSVYIEYYNNARTPAFKAFAPAHRGALRNQMQAVLVDGYLGVRTDVHSANDPFGIYDVDRDPQEAHNLANEPRMAALEAKMKARALQMRMPSPGSPRPYDQALVPADDVAGLVAGAIQFRAYVGAWPWVPDFRTLRPADEGTRRAIDATPVHPGVGGLEYEGYFHAEHDGLYRFFVDSDGGAELFLHQARVIDDDFARSGREATGAIRLAAGWHAFRLDYRHGDGQAQLGVAVQGPDGTREPLTAALLAAQPGSAAGK